MGLFSRKQPVSGAGIPKEILDDVTVNGEKKGTIPAFMPVTNIQEETKQSTSPFLSKTETAAAVLEENTRETGSPSAPEESPKPFSFTDQVSPDGAIHFADLGADKSLEGKQFSSEDSLKKVPDFSRITEDPSVQSAESPLSEVTLSQKRNFFSKGNIISIIVFLLILTLISGGSWYYLNTRSAIGSEASTESINELEVLTEEANSSGFQTISTDQPNYLRLDVESVSLADIQETLLTEGVKITDEGVTVPVEYLVTDLNNNPVAFSRFALLANANVPDVLINASKEPFSLYLYQEAGALKVALAVAIDEASSSNLKGQVNEVSQSLKSFLLPETEVNALPNVLTFNQADYNGQTIYYHNVGTTPQLSFDITFEDAYIIIANSKDMLRTVFDKRN